MADSDTDRKITLIEELRAFAAELGHPPTRQEMNEEGPRSSTPYYTAFGSWNDALEAAGLAVNHRNTISDQDLLAELQRLNDTLAHPPRWEDMEEDGQYSPHTYRRRWGSWLAAREAAGLAASETRPDRQVDREALIEALQDLAAKLGRTPTQADMNAQGEFSISPYYRTFGSWRDALAAAGMQVQPADPPRD